MTLSPNSSPSSDSRHSSSPTNSTSHDLPTPRSLQSGLPGLPSSPLHSAMGTAGPESTSSNPDVQPRQKSEESIRPSSSVSSSQAMDEDLVTSAEYDTGTSGSPPGEPGQSRQKKKRTRTLTTPHQSAVLHALLAQSRFPTTAVREEVGRSIGLSARKVQVWFQNQRQKARKPRSQSTSPLNHPPQFGAFSSGSQSESTSAMDPSRSAAPFQGDNQSAILPHQAYPSEHHPPPIHPSGLPGPTPGLRQHSLPDVTGGPSSHNTPRISQTYHYPNADYNVGPGPSSPPRGGASNLPQGPPYGPHIPYSPDPYGRHLVQGPTRVFESPIVLPPLRFDQPHTQTLPPPPIHRTGSQPAPERPRPLSQSSHSTSTSSISPALVTHFSPLVTLPPPPSRHTESIPPPFTLQPLPQWELSAQRPRRTPTLPPPLGLSESFHRSLVMRPRQHRTNSDPTRGLLPLSSLLHADNLRDQPQTLQPLSQPNLPSSMRGGRRFDPVHSVLREEQRKSEQSMEYERTTGSRANRHTYDFTGSSRNVVIASPPPNLGDSDDADRQKSD